jgi:photosystem II stability/assembly factor-like uncharacterized protein
MMKTILKIFTLVFLFSIQSIAQDFWKQTNGPKGNGLVNSIIIDSSGNVFAGTYRNGIYRSTDYGDNWTHINTDLTGVSVVSFAINSFGHIYAGTDSGVYRSTDNGDNWTKIIIDSNIYGISSFALNFSGDIFAATRGSIYYSNDNGENWTKSNIDSIYGGISSLDINSSGDIFAGTGYSNTRINIGRGGSIYRSFDNGDTWVKINSGLPDLYIHSIAINSVGYIYAASDSGVYRSIDNGDYWTHIGLTEFRVLSLTITPGGYTFAGTDNGCIYHSTDNGDNWTQTNIDLDFGIRCIAINSRGDIFAGTGNYQFDGSWGKGIYRSTDNGDHWTHRGLTYSGVGSLAINPNGDIFAIGWGSGVFRSTDNGDNWIDLYAVEMNNYFSALAINTSGHIFVCGFKGVYRSTDDGDNWTQTGLIDFSVQSLAINSTGHIFAGTDRNGVYCSTDNGDNWIQTGLKGISSNSMAINLNGHIFVGGEGVYRSTNGGENWDQTGLTDFWIRSLAVNSNGHSFAGTHDNGVYRSTDNGDNWTPTGLMDISVNSFVINSSGHIYAGTDGRQGFEGVYCSIDNGDNWSQTGLNNLTVLSLSINSSGYIFAGTWRGVYRSVQTTAVNEDNKELPLSFELNQNYPNPFNPSTTIEFTLPKSEFTTLKVFNILGKEVSTILSKKLNSGNHTYTFEGKNLASGIYYYQLVAGEYHNVKKMILIK